MNFYAHSTEDKSKSDWQLLPDHLHGVAQRMVDFSKEFASEEMATTIGLLHDIGKYQPSFQRKLEGSREAVEHSICGAQIWKELKYPDGGAYCIASHHSGLVDIGNSSNTADDSTLLGRLQRESENYSAYLEQITLPKLLTSPTKNAICHPDLKIRKKEYSFWVRMMFSCLVDADYLDTQSFYEKSRQGNWEIQETKTADFDLMEIQLKKKLSSLKQETALQQSRTALREQVLREGEKTGEIYTLNMPTGSGKTFTSLEFALTKAKQEGKKRIIYVIPFTSIIDQAAREIKAMFGKDIVLEHHSLFDFEGDTARESSGSEVELGLQKKLKRASENWNSPVILTTTVQLFESIYGNKPSKLRKIHNMTESILVFDEVHTLPILFLQPCLEAISILTSRYACKALLMSATLPDFPQWMEQFGCSILETVDLLPDKSLFPQFENCKFNPLHSISLDSLLENIQEKHHCLVVVNQRKTARLLYEKLYIKKYHLSTYMTVEHRLETIEKIKISLWAEEPFCLISTSLIEAGVDLDFDSAFRELAGLDNLLQTAGRCNREGKKDNCVTYSFSFLEEEYQTKNKDFQIKQRLTKDVFELCDRGDFSSVSSSEAISYYFNRLFDEKKEDIFSHDFETAICASSVHPNDVGFNFATYAEKFKLIDEKTTSVVVIREGHREKIEPLKEELRFMSEGAYKIKRKLQPYVVSLRDYELNLLKEQGVLSEINNIYFLENHHYYSEEMGILLEDNAPEHYIY